MAGSERRWLAESSELSRNVLKENSRDRRVMETLKKKAQPMLIVDFFHIFPGETVHIRDLENVLSREKGVFRIVLFEHDNVDVHIEELTRKLHDNLERLGDWTIVFTNVRKYSKIDSFVRLLENAEKMNDIVLVS